jgi:hypothetical protein
MWYNGFDKAAHPATTFDEPSGSRWPGTDAQLSRKAGGNHPSTS